MNRMISHVASVLIAIASLASSVFAVPTINTYSSPCAPTAGQYSRTFGNATVIARGHVYSAESQWLCQLTEEVRNGVRHMRVKDSTRT
jgi:hypothetical protein